MVASYVAERIFEAMPPTDAGVTPTVPICVTFGPGSRLVPGHAPTATVGCTAVEAEAGRTHMETSDSREHEHVWSAEPWSGLGPGDRSQLHLTRLTYLAALDEADRR
jgi:hypothetical protein